MLASPLLFMAATPTSTRHHRSNHDGSRSSQSVVRSTMSASHRSRRSGTTAPTGGRRRIGRTRRRTRRDGVAFTRCPGGGQGSPPAHEPRMAPWSSASPTRAAGSDEFRESIFDRFSQGEDARGTAGLGLPHRQGIVEAHGGRIWVESEPGRGATFLFTLRVSDGAAGAVA